MGGCYSASSSEAFKSPKHRLPKDRPGSQKKNGKLPKETYAYGDKSDLTTENQQLLEKNNASNNCDNEEEKKVITSDSGIESLAANSVKDLTENAVNHTDSNNVTVKSCDQDWYNRSSDLDVQTSATDDEAEDQPDEAAVQTYCSCGPRKAGNTAWHNNKCQTHMTSPKSYRHSDVSGLKSSFKDFMRKTEKRVRLSWKSTDSLDINKQMMNHLDRTKSEQSEIFRDDISFCAPLAQFDSISGNLDRQNSKNRISTLSTTSEIEAVAREICNCEFYANNLANELDVLVPERDESFPVEQSERHDSIDPQDSLTKESIFNFVDMDSNTDLELTSVCESSCATPCDSINTGTKSEKEKETRHKKVSENHVVKQVSLSSLSAIRPSLSSLGDVTLTTYEGKDMVMIDVETYTDILEELALLKSKLSQLTTLIQEDPVLDQAFQLMDSCQLNFDDSFILQDTVETEADVSN